MARYFMGGTRLAWLERMMIAPSKPMPPRTTPQQSVPQKKLTYRQADQCRTETREVRHE